MGKNFIAFLASQFVHHLYFFILPYWSTFLTGAEDYLALVFNKNEN